MVSLSFLEEDEREGGRTRKARWGLFEQMKKGGGFSEGR